MSAVEDANREAKFYWFVELLVQPPKYLRGHNEGDGEAHCRFWSFTADPHLADKYNKDQAESIAKKYADRGLNVEAREHGFMWVRP